MERTPPPSLFVVAGEPSGDLHAAWVIRELLALDPGLTTYGFGGARMRAQGFECLADLPARGVMGLFPVLMALPEIRGWFRLAVQTLATRRPDAVILVDYPGFNLRLAAQARRLGIPVIYYVSPQVWAWNRRRITRIARLVDLMLVILPFETEVYADTGLDVRYVGHPLVDHLAMTPADPQVVQDMRRGAPEPVIGLFPGSRRHVVRSLWPTLARTARRVAAALPGTRFITAAAEESLAVEVRRIDPLEDLDHVLVAGRTREVITAADLCLTTSGTTTLEIALHGKPLVLAYRVSLPLYVLGRLLIRVPHIGLVNLIAGDSVVPEYVGFRAMDGALADELVGLWRDADRRARMVARLADIRRRLDRPGSYRRTAELILEFVHSRRS